MAESPYGPNDALRTWVCHPYTSQTISLVLDTTKANVMEIWKAHGFRPTTDEERALMQEKNPHVDQCRCKFCQAREAA